MIFGDLVGLKFPDICLTGEEKPRKKNLTQETCPDRGIEPGRDRLSCYRMFHSGGPLINSWNLIYKLVSQYTYTIDIKH